MGEIIGREEKSRENHYQDILCEQNVSMFNKRKKIRVLALIPLDQGTIPSISWWFLIICNSSYRGPAILFWALLALYEDGTKTHELKHPYV